MTAGDSSSRVLTLLFTDLAGSTSLQMEKGDRAAGELFARHREHVERLAQEREGTIWDWAGDGSYLSFETPSTAVLFALDLQQVHHKEADLPGVYIGIHMGEVSEFAIDENGRAKPQGLAVTLASRIQSLSRPGQILMSAAVLYSARQQIGTTGYGRPILWKMHGAYPLKGFDNPVQVGEAGFEGLSPLVAPPVSVAIEDEGIEGEQSTEIAEPVDEDSARGLKYILRFTPEDFGKAASVLNAAVRQDRNNSWAHGALAYVYWEGSYQGWLQQLGVSYFEARLLAHRHLSSSLEGGSSFAHIVASEMQLYRRQYDAAVSEAKRANALGGDNPLCAAHLAHILVMADRCEEAMGICEKALGNDPDRPGYFLYRMGLAYFSMGQAERAIDMLEDAIAHDSRIYHYAAPLAAARAYLGQENRARAALEHYRKIRAIPPNLRDVMYFWPFRNTEVADRFAEGLRKAKLPGERSGYYRIPEMQRLTGKEIKDLLFGKTVTGFYPWTGQQEWIDRDWSGKATLRGGRNGETILDKGNSAIEGDGLIDQWQERSKGLKIGSPVYKNPAGSAATKDEYIQFTDFGFWPISPVG